MTDTQRVLQSYGNMQENHQGQQGSFQQSMCQPQSLGMGNTDTQVRVSPQLLNLLLLFITVKTRVE